MKERGPQGSLFLLSKFFQHLQNNIYATNNVMTITAKFQKPSNKKSTIIPTLNQKKAKPHTRLIISPSDSSQL